MLLSLFLQFHLLLACSNNLNPILLNQRQTAENIANAKLVAFETGGHMLIGHGEDTRAAIKDFLKQ
jgi:2-hydroxy-6-oxonona-2,4-dienedioate hydrolase